MAAARIPAPRTSPEATPTSTTPTTPWTPVARTPAPTPARRRRHDVPPAQLGSLTQRDHRPGTACTVCGSAHVTRLSMSLTDGTPVDFTSCHRCEHRSWEHAGDALAVESVLERSRKR